MTTKLKVITNEELLDELHKKINDTEQIIQEIGKREENKTLERDINSILEMLFQE